jgi:hypothetical protein
MAARVLAKPPVLAPGDGSASHGESIQGDAVHGLFVVVPLLIAHQEGSAGEIDHLRAFPPDIRALGASILAHDDEAIAEALLRREGLRLGCRRFLCRVRLLRRPLVVADKGKRVRGPRASPRKTEAEVVVPVRRLDPAAARRTAVAGDVEPVAVGLRVTPTDVDDWPPAAAPTPISRLLAFGRLGPDARASPNPTGCRPGPS